MPRLLGWGVTARLTVSVQRQVIVLLSVRWCFEVDGGAQHSTMLDLGYHNVVMLKHIKHLISNLTLH